MTRRLPVQSLLLVTMLCPEPAAAQSGDRDGQSSALRAPVFRVPVITVRCGEMRASAPGGDCPPDIPTISSPGNGDRWTLPLTDRLFVHGNMQFDTSSPHAAFGQTWQMRTGITYRAPGGIEITADVVGRRGYEAPLFVTAGGGTDGIPFITNHPILDTTRRPVLWDTVLRVEKDVFTAGRMRASIVGEAYNLVNINRDRDTKPLSETLTSRAGLLGMRFTF